MGGISEFMQTIPEDQRRAVISFVSLLPLGWAFRYLKNPTIRLSYGLLFGVILQYFIYANSMLHVLIATIINLILLKIVDRSRVGKIALIYNFGHNSLIHLYRLVFE
jgi:hypothetical protein